VINGTNNFNSNAKNTINLVHVLSPPPFFFITVKQTNSRWFINQTAKNEEQIKKH